MKKSRSRMWRALKRDARGAELAETAVVIPLLFMVLMAIFWFGQAFRIYGTLAHATRAGARAAVAPLCATCGAPTTTGPGQNAQTAVQNALTAAHLNSNQLVPTTSWTRTPPNLCPCRSGNSCASSVPCDPSVTNMCVQENVQLSFPNPGGMGTCGISVSARYKYPFHFTIPLTNLDLGNIQLPGQAQMRVETQ